MSLPNTYTRLNYIESSGTQWIDTGVNGGDSVAYEFTFRPGINSISNACFLCGADRETWPKLYQNTNIRYRLSIQSYPNHGSGTSRTLAVQLTDDVWTVSFSDTRIFINGIMYDKLHFYNKGWGSDNVYVFNRVTLDRACVMQCHSLKMWTDNTLVRDFIPVERLSDGELGLYDLANDVFYTNVGTGTFISGGTYVPPTPTSTSVNKVVYDNSTLIDITDTSATIFDVIAGKEFYAANGVKMLGIHLE